MVARPRHPDNDDNDNDDDLDRRSFRSTPPGDRAPAIDPSLRMLYQEPTYEDMDEDDDYYIGIKDGATLRNKQWSASGDSGVVGGSRKLFRISGLPEAEKQRWQRFYEAIVLDYIQHGPVDPTPEGDSRQNMNLDAFETNIESRYAKMFGENVPKMTEPQMRSVSLIFNFINLQVQTTALEFQ